MPLMLEFTEETAPHQIGFEAFGVQARICVQSPDLLPRVERFVPPGSRSLSPAPTQHPHGLLREEDGTYSIYHGTTRVSQGEGLELSLLVLEGQVRGHVAMNSPDMTFVHAGAVAHHGRAMIFPGRSFSGKSTLVAALVRAGATYYSDEFAVLDADGLVHPYAKPLSLRPDPPTEEVDYAVEELGGTAGVEPLPLGLAVITNYQPGAQWQPQPVASGAAALALFSNAVNGRSEPAVAMRAVTRAVENAIALEGERGEADQIANDLLARVNGRP
jgi:hypothetical protein